MPDANALAALHRACFTAPRPWSEAEIAGLLTDATVFLLEAPGGFLMGRAVAGEAELLTLAVDPAARRRGTGRSLLARFLDEARARRAETAFLEVSSENEAAIALYDSAGFVTAGRRRGYYATSDGRRTDALVLSRAL